MTQFPVTEAKISYDHLTFRSTLEVLKAETQFDWNEFWVRARDEEVMRRVAQAMLHAAAAELCRTSPDEHGKSLVQSARRNVPPDTRSNSSQ
jgi:hypothetical protein